MSCEEREKDPGTRKIDRRSLLKILAVAGAMASGAGLARASASSQGSDDDPVGILVDTTRCAGCRSCEFACAEANGLPEPDGDVEPGPRRGTSETQWTVVRRYDTDRGEIYVKRQCMHCVQPACGAACLTKAMSKTEEGPVVWTEGKCMGCRFCMVSCPFDMPKFEYNSPVPKIQKCRLCRDRLQRGELPACVENCPNEALTFGRRSELITEARRRIHGDPDSYVEAIYGEHDVGGTSILYLSSVPFDQIGFRTDLGNGSFPALTEDFLYTVPVVLTVLPALLLGLSQAAQAEREPAPLPAGVSHE